jgi:hypothetical protein
MQRSKALVGVLSIGVAASCDPAGSGSIGRLDSSRKVEKLARSVERPSRYVPGMNQALSRRTDYGKRGLRGRGQAFESPTAHITRNPGARGRLVPADASKVPAAGVGRVRPALPRSAAILVAEIDDVSRFPTPAHLCSWW